VTSSLQARKGSKLELTEELTVQAEIRLLLNFTRAINATDHFSVALLNVG